MEEVKVLTGTMDLDNSPEYVEVGDYGKAFNIRNTVIKGGDAGRVSFFNDIEKLPNVTFPSGINTVLKDVSAQDVTYVLVRNSNNRHVIVEEREGQTPKIIFTNLADTNDVDLLNWGPDTFINDFVLHKRTYGIYTDSVGEVGMFNLSKLSAGYGRPLTKQDVVLVKGSPLDSPKVSYTDYAELRTNKVLDSLYKFKYKYIYEGGLESAWSPSSAEVLPNNLNEISEDNVIGRQNLINVKMGIGHDSVQKIIVAVSEDGGEWRSIREVSRVEILRLPTTPSTSIGESLVSRIWNMTFYNPQSYSWIPADEADRNSEPLPKSANTLDIVNNNVLLLAGLPDIQDRAANLDVVISPKTFPVTGLDVIKGRGTLNLFKYTIKPFGIQIQFYEQYRIYLRGQPTPGDVIKIVTNYGMGGNPRAGITEDTSDVFEYVVTEADTTMTILNTNLARILPSGEVGSDADGQHVVFQYPPAGSIEGMRKWKTLIKVDIDLRDMGYVDTVTKRTFKSASAYQLALSYRDGYGRYLPLETDDTFKVDLPILPTTAIGQDVVGLNLDWVIRHNPPANAATYQWMISPDLVNLKYVDLVGEFRKEMSKPGRYITLDLTSLNRAKGMGIPAIDYQFTKGDRVYLKTYWEVETNNETIVPSFGRMHDLEVVGLEINAITKTDSRYLLKIQYDKEVWDWLLLLTGKEVAIKMSLYTPKTGTEELESLLFREIGPTMRIVNSTHAITSGTLEGIDDFVRGRVFEAFSTDKAKGVLVEDRNIKDEVDSIVPYRGNVRTYFDQMVGKDMGATIRFSDLGRENTEYDGINKFFEGRIYGEGPGETTIKHGEIKKIKIVGNYLKVLQESEVGVIPVYLSILQDNSGNIQTADSDILLNTVRYLGEGKVGVGRHAKSFGISDRGTIYFTDLTRGVPYRLSGASLEPLSRKVSHYFKNSIQDVIWGSCPDGEYWIRISSVEDGDLVLIYSEPRGGWVTFLEETPDLVSRIGADTIIRKGSDRGKLSQRTSGNSLFSGVKTSRVLLNFAAGFVRTFKSLVVVSGARPRTTTDGIVTELGHVSDLVQKDYLLKEGRWYANFLRDKKTGLFNGKLLKGGWVKINLEFVPNADELNLLKITIKSTGSTSIE